jgi:hypothetical protein
LELNQLIQPPEVASLVMEAQDHRAGNSYRALSDVDRKAMAKPTVEWVINGAIPKQDLTAAVGRPKVGKTRKSIAAVKSVLTGCPFMGFEPVGTEDTVVILITDDQSAGDTAVMLEAAGLYNHPRLLWSQRFRLTEEQLDQLLSDIKSNPGAFVVIDSLRSITRSSGAKENDAEMGMLVYDLKQSVIDAGGSLLLVHHGNKDDKAVGMEAMSGHNSIAGACNTILSTHYLEDERGFACKDSPMRRVVREARSGQGADLVVEIKPDGSFERVDSFEGFARSKVAADLQQQEVAALQKPPKAVVALIQALVQLFEEDQPHLPTLEVMKLAGLVRQTVQFKADFNKAYASVAEEAMHRAAFEENLAKIIAHNRDRTKTWRMGVNQMADRPRQALISSKHGYHKGEAILRRSSPANTASSSENLLRRPSKSLDRFTRMGADATQQLFPYEVDWRKQGVVTAVKNQGQCG